jgi:hypothetical protein
MAASFAEQRRPFYPPPAGGKHRSAQGGGAQNAAELSGLEAGVDLSYVRGNPFDFPLVLWHPRTAWYEVKV